MSIMLSKATKYIDKTDLELPKEVRNVTAPRTDLTDDNILILSNIDSAYWVNDLTWKIKNHSNTVEEVTQFKFFFTKCHNLSYLTIHIGDLQNNNIKESIRLILYIISDNTTLKDVKIISWYPQSQNSFFIAHEFYSSLYQKTSSKYLKNKYQKFADGEKISNNKNSYAYLEEYMYKLCYSMSKYCPFPYRRERELLTYLELLEDFMELNNDYFFNIEFNPEIFIEYINIHLSFKEGNIFPIFEFCSMWHIFFILYHEFTEEEIMEKFNIRIMDPNYENVLSIIPNPKQKLICLFCMTLNLNRGIYLEVILQMPQELRRQVLKNIRVTDELMEYIMDPGLKNKRVSIISEIDNFVFKGTYIAKNFKIFIETIIMMCKDPTMGDRNLPAVIKKYRVYSKELYEISLTKGFSPYFSKEECSFLFIESGIKKFYDINPKYYAEFGYEKDPSHIGVWDAKEWFCDKYHHNLPQYSNFDLALKSILDNNYKFDIINDKLDLSCIEDVPTKYMQIFSPKTLFLFLLKKINHSVDDDYDDYESFTHFIRYLPDKIILYKYLSNFDIESLKYSPKKDFKQVIKYSSLYYFLKIEEDTLYDNADNIYEFFKLCGQIKNSPINFKFIELFYKLKYSINDIENIYKLIHPRNTTYYKTIITFINTITDIYNFSKESGIRKIELRDYINGNKKSIDFVSANYHDLYSIPRKFIINHFGSEIIKEVVEVVVENLTLPNKDIRRRLMNKIL